MRKMEELREMLCEELDKITKKGELSAGSLDVIDKLTHSIKSIDTIIAMEESESGYSYEYSRARDGRRGGNSNAQGRRRDSMGRYSRDNEYDMRGGNSNGYSRDDEMHNLKSDLHEMLENAESEEQRRMIRNWIKQVE